MRKNLHLAIWVLLAGLFAGSPAFAQNGNITGVTWSSTGRPAAGVSVAICGQLTSTSASVTNNIATIGFASNPLTQGFTIGQTLVVFGYTGGDTYFNGTWTVAGVSSSTVSYALTHANASASSNGTVYETGTVTNACAPLAALTTDNTAAFSSPNPFTSDGLGNYTAWATPGYYRVQTYGSNYGIYIYNTGVGCVPGSTVACGGTMGGSISTGQSAFATGSNTLGGSVNYLWSTPVAGALNLNSTDGSEGTAHGALVAFTNSNIAGTSYIQKWADGSFVFNGDGLLIPNHGYLAFNCQNTSSNCDVDLRSGSGGGSCYWNTTASVGISLPAGSVDCEFPNSGVGTAKFQLHSGTPNFSTYQWESSNGCMQTATLNTTNFAGWCPPDSGTPHLIKMPITSPNAGQVWSGDGSTPTKASWITIGVECGTIAAGGACANTTTTAPHCVSGIATLSGGSSTITGISPAFTSSTSFSVTTSDTTTKANSSLGLPASGSSITFTGTGTDNIQFIACGG